MPNTLRYNRKNYTEEYGPVMKFERNKDEYIHRWYPFVEGYSKGFIRSIIEELDNEPQICLDPFAGSGTTPLELQKLGKKCFSFEVCPLMYDLSVAKMRTDYTVIGFIKNLNLFKENLISTPINIHNKLPIPDGKWIMEKDGLNKWNFNRSIIKGILDIKYSISLIKDPKYRNLFNIALASILLKVSNVYRNGKCVSYKPNWQQKINYTREEVHDIFLSRLEEVFLPDIKKMQQYKKHNSLYSNYKHCILGDSRKSITFLDNESIDLIITSPPYLNSRDYTDSYMIELKMLDYLKKYSSMNEYRSQTIRSHVQVKWPATNALNISKLKSSIKKIQNKNIDLWNESIIDMINGYFEDMDLLFTHFSRILTKGGYIYFNVANSAYYGVEIKVDEIIAEIAASKGLQVEEIRNARFIRPSSQQKDSIPHLLESVLVIRKNL